MILSPHFDWVGTKLAVEAATPERLKELAARKETVALDLASDREALRAVITHAREIGLEVWGWIEVARDPGAAAAHPEWMHAPQHHEWLQAFPEFKAQGGTHPAVVSDWICLNNRAAFDYALARIVSLVQSAPPLDGLLLNDIQGPPAGCGCGNILCRSWDNSPGEKIAPTPYVNPDTYFSQVFWQACADALTALPANPLSPSRIVPILCGECELSIQMGPIFSPDDTLGSCNGIPCGTVCALHYWPGMVRAFAREQGGPDRVGMLTPYKLFGRDVPLYGETGAWISASLDHYRSIDPSARLIAVVQGWNVSTREIEAQRSQAARGGASGLLVLEEPLDQSYRPLPLPKGYRPVVPPIMCGYHAP